MRPSAIAAVLIVILMHGQTVAGASIHGPNIECKSIAFSGPDDPKITSQIEAAMRDAIARKDWPSIRALVWNGADPELARGSPWYDAAKREKLNAKLVKASAAGNTREVIEALQSGVDVNLDPEPNVDQYMPPLIWAAGCGHLEVVKLLLARGANVNILGSYLTSTGTVGDVTALAWAAYYANDEIVRFLLSNGAEANIQEYVTREAGPMAKQLKWDTALLASGSATTTEILLRHKADPNIVRSDGTSPLMLAAQNGDFEQALSLVDHGASALLTNDDGMTAANVARANKHGDIAALLDRSASKTQRSAE